jgi:hypothetical protein
MSLRSAKYVNNNTEAHVKEPNREHDRNHGNQPTRGLHTSPTRPPDDEAAHAGAANIGGVIGPMTRDTDYTRFTGGSISVLFGSSFGLDPLKRGKKPWIPFCFGVFQSSGLNVLWLCTRLWSTQGEIWA